MSPGGTVGQSAVAPPRAPGPARLIFPRRSTGEAAPENFAGIPNRIGT